MSTDERTIGRVFFHVILYNISESFISKILADKLSFPSVMNWKIWRCGYEKRWRIANTLFQKDSFNKSNYESRLTIGVMQKRGYFI